MENLEKPVNITHEIASSNVGSLRTPKDDPSKHGVES